MSEKHMVECPILSRSEEMFRSISATELAVARIEERQIAFSDKLDAHDRDLNGNGREGLKDMTRRLHEAHMRRDRHIMVIYAALVTAAVSLVVAHFRGVL